MVVARDWGREKWGVVWELLNGCRVSILQNAKVLEISYTTT
jgi:hypothetical protein